MQALIKRKQEWLPDIRDFNAKKITRDSDDYYIMIKRSSHRYSNTKCGNTNQ